MSGKGWIIVCGGRGETQFGPSDSRIDRELCWLWNADLCPNIERTWREQDFATTPILGLKRALEIYVRIPGHLLL